MSNKKARNLDPRVAALRSSVTQFASSNGCMSANGVAVFAEGALIVPDARQLAGGPDFIRLVCPSALPAAIIVAAIDKGGDEDLIEMMNILRDDLKTERNARRLSKAGHRFMRLVYSLARRWVAAQKPNDTRH